MVHLPKPTKSDLQRHFFASYNSIRIGNAIIATIFPLVLLLMGALHGIENPGSMSAYYWATPAPPGKPQDKASNGRCESAAQPNPAFQGITPPAAAELTSTKACPMPMADKEHLSGRLGWIPVHAPPGRMWFVVGMFCIATFLYLYKGFSKSENYVLNLAAVLAILVACYPMEWNCREKVACQPEKFSYCFDGINPHGVSAVSMFACLAYVVFLRAKDTLPALENEALERKFKAAYRATGASMILFPSIAVLLHAVKGDFTEVTFYLEAAGIWAFSLYWVVKSIEMRYSQLA